VRRGRARSRTTPAAGRRARNRRASRAQRSSAGAEADREAEHDADDEDGLEEDEERLRALAERRLQGEEQGRDEDRLAEPAPTSAIVPARPGGANQAAGRREASESTKTANRTRASREAQLAARDGQRFDPLRRRIGAQERPEIAEERKRDQRARHGEREEPVGERRQRAAREPAQDGRRGPVRDDRRGRPLAGAPVRREPRAEDGEHAVPHDLRETTVRRSMDLLIPGPEGKLEADALDAEGDGAAPRAACAFCHPHPLGGGTMANNVVFRAARGLQLAGLAVLRFNFRGVGKSEGVHDGKGGEEEDLKAALDHLAKELPGTELWTGGFSFGARTAASYARRDSGSSGSCSSRSRSARSTCRSCAR
jgi:hypothetical protein